MQYRFLKISGGGPPDPPSKARLASLDGPRFVPRKLLSGLTYMRKVDRKGRREMGKLTIVTTNCGPKPDLMSIENTMIHVISDQLYPDSMDKL